MAITWPGEGQARGFGDATQTPAIEDIQTQILAWETRTDAERFYKAEALKLSEDVMKTRWRLPAASSIAALSVALALYLILELDRAFDGYIRISSAPVRYVLEQLGK